MQYKKSKGTWNECYVCPFENSFITILHVKYSPFSNSIIQWYTYKSRVSLFILAWLRWWSFEGQRQPEVFRFYLKNQFYAFLFDFQMGHQNSSFFNKSIRLWFGNWHHPTPHCQITNEWFNWKKLFIWIYYFLITNFLSYTRFLVFWIFRPLAPPLSCFDTIILVRTSCQWHHIIY